MSEVEEVRLFFESAYAFVRYWMIVPVVFIARISFAKLKKPADKLRIAQVLMVIKVEQDLIARHFLKVNVIMYWYELFLVLRPHL